MIRIILISIEPMSTESESDPLKSDVMDRMRFIERRLYSVGWLNRLDLMRCFQISQPQASRDIQRYLQHADGNVTYDHRKKAYVADSDFSPVFWRVTLDDFAMRTAETSGDLRMEVVSPLMSDGKLYDTGAVRRTLWALAQGCGVRLEVPDAAGRLTERLLLPTVCFRCSDVWYIRGEEEGGGFRQVALPSVLEAQIKSGIDAPGTQADTEWNRTTTVFFDVAGEVDHRLRERMVRAVGAEGSGRLSLRLRACLLDFVPTFMALFERNFGLESGAIRRLI